MFLQCCAGADYNSVWHPLMLVGWEELSLSHCYLCCLSQTQIQRTSQYSTVGIESLHKISQILLEMLTCWYIHRLTYIDRLILNTDSHDQVSGLSSEELILEFLHWARFL